MFRSLLDRILQHVRSFSATLLDCRDVCTWPLWKPLCKRSLLGESPKKENKFVGICVKAVKVKRSHHFSRSSSGYQCGGNSGSRLFWISSGDKFSCKGKKIYPGSRRLVKGHQLQPGNVLGPRSKSLPGPWTTSLCLKGVESESDDISIQIIHVT